MEHSNGVTPLTFSKCTIFKNESELSFLNLIHKEKVDATGCSLTSHVVNYVKIYVFSANQIVSLRNKFKFSHNVVYKMGNQGG